MSVISIKQLLEAGVQFGHPTRQWNPKMKQYIFVARNDTHIIDLEQTVVLAEQAYNYVCNMVKQGKNVLFVGTKKQATEAVKEEAERCGMYYVNNRWLGGTLTNFKTIRSRVDRLNKLEQMEKTGEFEFFPKKEVLSMRNEMEKLQKNLGGIKDMTSLPGLLFVVDLKKEHIALKEAKALGIPVVGLVDTNCDPEMVDVVIPGNDDAIRSVKLIAELVANAVIEAKTGEVYSIKEEDMSQEEVEKAMVGAGEQKQEAKAEKPAAKKAPVKKAPVAKEEKEEKPAAKKAAAEKTEEKKPVKKTVKKAEKAE